MPVNLDEIRKRREERRQAMLAAAQEPEASNGKQPAAAVEETPEPVAPPMERRRRTTRDEAIAERQAASPDPVAKQEEDELVDTVQVDGKTMAVYEAPKPEVLVATGVDDALVARVVAEVRKAVREEFGKLHIRFGLDGQERVENLTRTSMQMLRDQTVSQSTVKTVPATMPRQRRQPESEGYKKFKAEWRAKSEDERVAYAKQVGAKWVAHPDAKIDAMRMQMAVREALGVEKYN